MRIPEFQIISIGKHLLKFYYVDPDWRYLKAGSVIDRMGTERKKGGGWGLRPTKRERQREQTGCVG